VKEDWSDFEKYVFEKLERLTQDVSILKGKAAAWGAFAGIIGFGVCELIVKIWPQ
jgi:hypothetical protein